jgi:hypothetical protein
MKARLAKTIVMALALLAACDTGSPANQDTGGEEVSRAG